MKSKISDKVGLKNRRIFLRKNNTNSELFLWQFLSNKKFHNLKFRRQHSFGNYIVDFYCREKKIVVELDGDPHFTQRAIEYDANRTKYLNGLGLQVIRFTNDEILEDIENCLIKISNFCGTPPNLPSKEGRN